MSDIKYIIVGEDGEHTRFPCLAMVRWAMAAAVTFLAIAVVALVIHAVLRSEDVHLSVNNGYIGADNLWERVEMEAPNQPSSLTKVVAPELGSFKPAADPASETQLYEEPEIDVNIGSRSGLPKECYLGCPSAGIKPAAQVTLQKAEATNLRVLLISNNPGGRTKIDCNDTTVSIFDLQAPYGKIGMVKLENFSVQSQVTTTLHARLKNASSSYIWEHYAGEVRFSVKVQVNLNVTSFPLGKPQTKPQSYMCQPVTVGLMDDEAIYATDQVDCMAQ